MTEKFIDGAPLGGFVSDPAEISGPGFPQARKHQAEWVRDVPTSCVCPWEWSIEARMWKRIGARTYCPWHLSVIENVPWSAEVQ